MTGRREFMLGAGLAAAGAFTGCATRKGVAWKLDEKAFVKAALLHLGSNMWCDVRTPIPGDKPPAEDRWDFKDSVDYLRASDDDLPAFCEMLRSS